MSSTFETFGGDQNEAVNQVVKAAGEQVQADNPGFRQCTLMSKEFGLL
jgi:hypothetical protein